jgi:hypothetical protein
MASPNELSFLPDGYLEQKAQRRANAICAALFLLVMAGVGSAFTLSERATRRIDEQYAAVEQQCIAEARHIEQMRQMEERQRHMAHQAELTASLLEKVPRSNILAAITNCCDAAGVSLLDLTMDSKERQKAAAKAEAPKTAYEQKKAARSGAPAPLPEAKSYDIAIKLTGIGQTDVQVAQFLSNLNRARFFRDVNLVITDQITVGENKLRKFQIEMMLDRDVDLVPLPRATASVEMLK